MGVLLKTTKPIGTLILAFTLRLTYVAIQQFARWHVILVELSFDCRFLIPESLIGADINIIRDLKNTCFFEIRKSLEVPVVQTNSVIQCGL